MNYLKPDHPSWAGDDPRKKWTRNRAADEGSLSRFCVVGERPVWIIGAASWSKSEVAVRVCARAFHGTDSAGETAPCAAERSAGAGGPAACRTSDERSADRTAGNHLHVLFRKSPQDHSIYWKQEQWIISCACLAIILQAHNPPRETTCDGLVHEQLSWSPR